MSYLFNNIRYPLSLKFFISSSLFSFLLYYPSFYHPSFLISLSSTNPHPKPALLPLFTLNSFSLLILLSLPLKHFYTPSIQLWINPNPLSSLINIFPLYISYYTSYYTIFLYPSIPLLYFLSFYFYSSLIYSTTLFLLLLYPLYPNSLIFPPFYPYQIYSLIFLLSSSLFLSIFFTINNFLFIFPLILSLNTYYY